MLWEIEIQPKGSDTERDRIRDEYALLTHEQPSQELVQRSARGYLLEGDLDRDQVEQLLEELLLDPLVETGRAAPLATGGRNGTASSMMVTVLLKPGVMDPAAMSIVPKTVCASRAQSTGAREPM